jgi:two-component system NarL family sensor kinase
MKISISPLLISFFTLFILVSPIFGQIDSVQTIEQKLEATQSVDEREDIMLDYLEMNYRNEPEKCLDLAKQLIELSKANNHESNLAKAYSFAGALYKNSGEFSTALSYHFESEQLNLKSQDKKALATNYNDIGIIYKTMGEFDKALEYYKKANSLTVELGMKRGIVMTLNNIGTIYEAKSDFDAAVLYFKQSYDKAIEFDILGGQAIALSNLGEIFGMKGDDKTARSYFRKALSIDEKTNDVYGSVISTMNLAGTFIKLNEADSALYFYNLSEAKAKELKAKQLLVHIYSGKVELFTSKNDYFRAFESLKMYTRYQDSIYNEAKAEELVDAEKKYEALKKDQEIQNLKNAQVISEIKHQQYQSERIAWISLVTLGIVILFYLYKRYKQKQIQEFSKKMLQQKELYLKAIVETQEDERKRIAKDLHDGIGQTLSGIKLSLVNIVSHMPEAMEKDKLSELSQVVDAACIDVRSISHQMMPRLLQEEGLIPSIADMLDKSFRLSKIQYNFEHFGMESRVKENIEISVYRICQELINNIIKHSEASQVNVQLFRNGKMLVLLVEDNGKGFMFDKQKSTGIGLMNISSRVETVHGEFNLEPSPHSGTLATIRIPIVAL